MNNDINDNNMAPGKPDEVYEHNRGGRIAGGLVILAVGIVFLLKELDIHMNLGISLPTWLFSWPMLLIALGLFMGAKHTFKKPGWILITAVGAVFLAEELTPGFNMAPLIWPVLIILFALFIIFKKPGFRNRDCGRFQHEKWRRFRRDMHRAGYERNMRHGQQFSAYHPSGSNEVNPDMATEDDGEFLDLTAVLGGNQKRVFSKNFKGGDVTAFLGGNEIDLTQADFTGKVRLEITQVMGGTKLIIPSSWDVVVEVTSVMGGIEDKRKLIPNTSEKVLILVGTSIMAGIEIKSY